ncbi:molecular chaperone [uncultured Adlercreutzia sp.]|uniref:TorD/DmsD family molecular chaperone n=1 Tax=uncultured Adlercreutzia sp. TaxID=875803 RepID=UPI0026F3A62E|nr:molecular chaperone TorD family protein [uncultured Adlercreutzia sp.]
MDAETRELVLANRQFVWGLIARGFAEEPDGPFADILTSEHARAEVDLVSDGESEKLLGFYDELVALISRDGGIPEAADQFVRVFVGPGTLAASPWETMHTTGKRVLFHRDVLSVRDAYREAGFLPERYRAVADDAIGLECDFMAKLAERAVAANTAGDARACQDRLLQSLTFLTDHLQRWIGSLAQAIEEHYGAENFYAVLARFTEAWCARDRRLLDGLLEDSCLASARS